MTYQVLARKWRPGTFADLVGQAHVLKPLTHALDNQRLHHAYLFTGTRGVGKTTLARILARCLNCDEGVSAQPCGTCEACKEITEGRFIDLIEVDAASRTKVEDTRELLENVQYAPSRGRYKIYLIDEVHMLSTHSFNALLKTLEEPPPHVKFLLATTDPQKLPVTILSRCLQFNLKNLSPQLIQEYLVEILQREQIESDESALWQLANAAAGSMRDALTLLDQAISFCEGQVTAAGVSDMLGLPEQGVIWQLLDHLAEQNVAAMLQTVEQVSEQAPDFSQLLEALLAVLHRLAVAQVVPDAVDNAFGDRQQVLEYANRFSAEDIQLYFQMALKGRADLNLAPDARAMFEMLMIRLLVFVPEGVPAVPKGPVSPATETAQPGNTEASVVSLSSPVTGGQQKKKTLKNPAKPVQAKRSSSAPEPATVPVVNLSASSERIIDRGKTVQISNESDMAGSGPVSAERGTSGSGPSSEEPSTAGSGPTACAQLHNDNWRIVLQQLGLGGIIGNILAHCVILEAAENDLRLCLDSSQSAVFSEDHRVRIEQALGGYFQRPLQVEIEIGVPPGESPAAYNKRLKMERLERLRSQFQQDSNVQALVETFAGEVLEESIAPIRQ